ncbi:hypothetical protein RMSM_01985 [Rhodopirellula maiorica SM1]|uniref:Uncharacterized protein n=1 Tax=Rhodopirellula maiorica SM1 TaxID=1265738 RepID=M5RP08_9BACT|nr:hypothetical protein RMSM_01985 [Rhodopirellula maiorica SM1]
MTPVALVVTLDGRKMLAGKSYHLPAILDAPSTLHSIRRPRMTDA